MLRLGERAGKVATWPYIALLREDNVRTGFFEPEQFAAVRARLPEDLRPAVEFAYLTGWRLRSEILTLQWWKVDFGAGMIRLEPGSTKNADGRAGSLRCAACPRGTCTDAGGAYTGDRAGRPSSTSAEPGYGPAG